MKSLTEARKAAGLLQKDLAELVGVSAVTICRHENDTRSMPVKMAKKIAKILHVEWQKFYED